MTTAITKKGIDIINHMLGIDLQSEATLAKKDPRPNSLIMVSHGFIYRIDEKEITRDVTIKRLFSIAQEAFQEDK